MAGGAAAAGVIAYGLLRRKPPLQAEVPAPEGPDPRAQALREKLAVSRELAAERDVFEAGETTVDAVDIDDPATAEEAVEERRRAVHARGRAAVDDMQQRAD